MNRACSLLWGWFGLSYCGYLVLPRAVICDMPEEQQRKIMDVLEYIETNYKTENMPGEYMVRAKSKGRFVADPLSKYRMINMEKFRRDDDGDKVEGR